MAHFKKQCSKILLCILAFSFAPIGAVAPIQTSQSKKDKPLSQAISTKMPIKKTRFEHLANKINLSSQDLSTILFVSPALFSMSFLTNNRTAKIFLRCAALIPPLAAIALPKSVVEKLAKIPSLKQFFQFFTNESSTSPYCTNKPCEGFCTECKARRLYMAIPIAAIPFFMQFCYGKIKAYNESFCNQCRWRGRDRQPTPCCQRNLCQKCSDFYMNSAYWYQCPLCNANTPAGERQCRICRARDHTMQTPCCNRNVCQQCWNLFDICIFCRTANPAARERRDRAWQEQEARDRRQYQQPPQPRQPNNQNADHYQILGIAQNASAQEIRTAYRRLALQFHPDKAAANNITPVEATRRFQQINEANQVLSNPDTRREYDETRRIYGGYNRW